MPATDPIADMLTRIRNGLHRRMDSVRVRKSKLALAVAQTLLNEGYIAGVEAPSEPALGVQGELLILLKYGPAGEAVISRLDRVSRPGRRMYAPVSSLKPVMRGLGIRILSTPKGVMSDRQARQANVGGEVLCIVE